ncbi:PilT/PilU family type 4a pilus ATPase [Simplicispira piscis]
MDDLKHSGDPRLLSCLQQMVRAGASDLFLIAGAPPTLKRQGGFFTLGSTAVEAHDVRDMAYSVMDAAQVTAFESCMECDLAYQTGNADRFRINVHRQRGQVGMVVRYVSPTILSLDALGLPAVLKQLAFLKGGLVLAVGAAGSGKTTTLASLLDYRNAHTAGHILTIEDPIEYLHAHKKSLMTQREVGIDTLSYDEALRHAMREAPDVIMIGEIRDRTSMQHALHYAESGHLCISTLHANNASQAVQRILNFFPEEAHGQLRMDLSLNLKAVVAQRLIVGTHKRQVPAVEVMLLTHYVSELIQKGQIEGLRGAIERTGEVGMCTFDQSIFQLFERGEIAQAEAVAHADNKTDMALRMRLAAGASLSVEGMHMAPNADDDAAPPLPILP